jgi:hypothetical protein
MRFACIVLLLLSSSALGDVTLTGPDSVAFGKSAIVKLPLTESGADFSWQVLPADVNWIAGENRTDTYVVILDVDKPCFVSFASFDKKAHAVKVVNVDGSTPPGPGPTPPTPGPVPLPDGKYKLAAQARDWMSTVPADHRGKAKDLANSFRGVASAIAAGTMKRPEDVLAATKSSNNAALGSSMDAWKPWGAKLQTALEKADTDGTLRTIDDYKVAWNEIADGLEASVIKAPALRK